MSFEHFHSFGEFPCVTEYTLKNEGDDTFCQFAKARRKGLRGLSDPLSKSTFMSVHATPVYLYSRPSQRLLVFCTRAAPIAFLNPYLPGYLTKQESIAVLGVDELLIRSLLDKQQFHDPLDEALNLGISSATWPLFGLLWPSGLRLAERMASRPVTGERILEIGCGLGLASLVAHRRGAQVTASDCHPLAHAFLDENTRINGLAPMPYCHGLWGTAAAREDGLPMLTQQHDAPLSGLFDLIVGSDILYERDDAGSLAQFIDEHAARSSEIWVIDPNRGNRAAFHKHMAQLGFAMHEQVLDLAAHDGVDAYKGRMLTYLRRGHGNA